MSKTIKHILVIRLSAMGDVAMTIPVLRAFAQQYPEVKLTVLTRAFFRPFFRDIPNISIYEADVKGTHKGILGLYKLSKELRALDIDAIADLHNVLRSKILKLFLSSKPCEQIDKGRKEKKELVSGKKFEQLKTTHQRYVDVFSDLGFPIDVLQPKFPETVRLSEALKAKIGESLDGYIGIAPFAAFKSKAYPLDQMEEVIAEISKEHKILLFGGGKAEVETLNKISSKYENTLNLAGELSLNEELDVISNLTLMVSMDSGNAHIAAMLGTEVVTLWGVTHPYAGFFPFDQKIENAILADRKTYPLIPTSVYGNKFPEGYENAIASISSESVVEKIMSVIKKASLKK